MQQDKKYKTLAIIFWILVVLCLGVIFYFSAQPANDSNEQSSALLEFIKKILGDNIKLLQGHVGQIIVRKGAHFTEYTGLGLLTNCAFYFSFRKKQLVYGVGLASVYAITDEVHQIFIEGRSCQFTDWLIDTSGAILGMLIFLVLFLIFKKADNKSKEIYNEHLNI